MIRFERTLLLLIGFLMIFALTLKGVRKSNRANVLGNIAAFDSTYVDDVRLLKNDTVVINTTRLGAEVVGYNDIVPLEIYLLHGEVVRVEALENEETPRFMKRTLPMLSAWEGKTIQEAIDTQVDGVTKATFTSNAIKQNMALGLEFAREHKLSPPLPASYYLLDALVIVIALLTILFVILECVRQYKMKKHHKQRREQPTSQGDAGTF